MKRKLLTLLLVIASVFGIFALASNNAEDVEAANTKTIYFTPGSTWTKDNARFAIYSWGGTTGNSWNSMTKIGSSSVYRADIPSGDTKIIFCRMNPSNSTNDWNNKWNQSGDINLVDGKNHFIKNNNWNDTWTASSPNCSWNVYNTEVVLVGSFNNWSTTETKFTKKSDFVYELELELENGKVEFKIIEDGFWHGNGSSFNDATSSNLVFDTSKSDAKDNAVLNATGGTYTFSYNTNTNGLTVAHHAHKYNVEITDATVEEEGQIKYTCTCGKSTVEVINKLVIADSAVLKSLINEHYNAGKYTRTTHIYIDKTAISSDFATHFHNAQGGDNVYLNRTTEFVADYLYFVETKVGFGTSASGKLVSFTWNGEYKSANTDPKVNAIEDAFYTLYDLMNAEAEWTVLDGVYTTTDESVIKIAEGFTAPGWQSPTKAYTDYTKVTVSVVEGKLCVQLWVSATNSGIVTSTPEGNHVLFAEAIIG